MFDILALLITGLIGYFVATFVLGLVFPELKEEN